MTKQAKTKNVASKKEHSEVSEHSKGPHMTSRCLTSLHQAHLKTTPWCHSCSASKLHATKPLLSFRGVAAFAMVQKAQRQTIEQQPAACPNTNDHAVLLSIVVALLFVEQCRASETACGTKMYAFCKSSAGLPYDLRM